MSYISGVVTENCTLYLLGPDHNKIAETNVTCTSGNFSHNTNGKNYYYYTINDITCSSGVVMAVTASGEVLGYSVVDTVSDVDNYTKLLLHFDEDTFIDHSNSGHIITRNNGVARNNTQHKFGGYSCYFDGADDYISVPDSEDWNFGSGDFTIDCWIRLNDVTVNGQTIVAHYVDANNRMWFGYSPDPSIGLRIRVLSGGSDVLLLSQGSLSGWVTGIWYHVALVRNGNIFSLYRDGILLTSTTNSTTLPNFNAPLSIGITNNESKLYGYMDEFRISKGIARWKSNFTPPNMDYRKNTGTVTATGGNLIVTYGGYKIHTFTGSGTFEVTNVVGTPMLEYLVVGGGGGGGRAQATGGAGGTIVIGSITPTIQSYTVTVGGGGAGGTAGSGQAGGSSVFGSITAGGGSPGNTNGNPGPSGNGYTGGAIYGSGFEIRCGGGAGGGGNGQNGTAAKGGDGGIGRLITFDFVNSNYYAGGGGGGSYSASYRAPSSGGLGGGGNGSGSNPNNGPTAGTSNTGGGGGGGGQIPGITNGAAGGSGIVILRYKI